MVNILAVMFPVVPPSKKQQQLYFVFSVMLTNVTMVTLTCCYEPFSRLTSLFFPNHCLEICTPIIIIIIEFTYFQIKKLNTISFIIIDPHKLTL